MQVWRRLRLVCWVACLLAALPAAASEYHGWVLFNGLPVPGANATATRGDAELSAVTGADGSFEFADLADGEWTIRIEMTGFAAIDAKIAVAPNAPAGKWELTMLSLDRLMAMATQAPAASAAKAAGTPAAMEQAHATDLPAAPSAATSANGSTRAAEPLADANQDSSDGFLVNGSVNNAATSIFALSQAFGNNRAGGRSLYNGGIAAIFDNSVLDARPYSLSGEPELKPDYDRLAVAFTVGGPMKIPHLLPRGPKFFFGYQGARDHIDATETGLVPTAAERAGDLSALLNATGEPVTIYDPGTGQPFRNNMVPVSEQAKALLGLYPLPNIAGALPYNYQAAVLNSSHRDLAQLRLDKSLGRRDQIYGGFNLQSTRAADTNLFAFVDTTDALGINSNIHWSHSFNRRLFVTAAYNFSRLRTLIRPEFENHVNISGAAGINGNDQDPADWGPPSLNFSSGFAALSDAQSAFNRSRTDGFSASALMLRGRHNITVGGDLRKQQYNELFQQDPRGTFTFTGAATQNPHSSASESGSDLADFLIGVSDTSAIAFGNADKYLREPVYDAYATDDWRPLANLTLNLGVRWEYGAPMTELFGRLVNLDIASGFAAVAPVLASDPAGQLTGSHYPRSLVRPDRLGVEPRLGFSWRPIPASTLVIRGGYGIYRDTSVYLSDALAMAQQAPLSKSLSVARSAECPLTLARGFVPCTAITQDTFAIDPNFRVGYAQTWTLAVQRDLPGSMQMTATYLGTKGTRGEQEFLPNTYPIGAANPCPACPLGFAYGTSNGDSTRESGQLQLRRRLRSGFTATGVYTFSKSIDDDAALGGAGYQTASQQGSDAMEAEPAASVAIAQNWRDPQAERSLSSFDQRHLFTLQAQYTTGQGLHGGDLMTGWAGRLLKEWTLLSQVTAGTGLPETPIYLAALPGAGYTGTIRPDRTTAAIDAASGTRHLNPAAFTAPVSGQWGTAGRDSITGPGQFSLDSSIGRTFRTGDRFHIDARVDATNLLNHAVFTNWNTTINSTQFGLPLAANAMRSLQMTVRLRF